MFPHPLDVLFPVRGVDNRHVPIFVKAAHHQIVHNPAAFIEHGRIAHLSVHHAPQIVGHEKIERVQRARPFKQNLAHVRYVKQTARFPHRHVFFNDSLVLHRQQIPRKRHDLSPQGYMQIVQRRLALQSRHLPNLLRLIKDRGAKTNRASV